MDNITALIPAVNSVLAMGAPGQTGVAAVCKRCNSPRIIKSGFFHNIQRYCCKDCGSVFILNQAPFHSRLPVAAVVITLERFFAGEPLDSIRRLLADNLGIQPTVTALEKMVYRFSSRAVELAGDITPDVGPRWFLEGDSFDGARPVVILDVLDLRTGFLIASDLVPDYAEKDRESVLQRALRVTGSTPELLIVSPLLLEEYVDDDLKTGFADTRLKKVQQAILQNYRRLAVARTVMVSRRLNFDSIANCRLLCSAWRIHYNFLSGLQPEAISRYNTWLDIVSSFPISSPFVAEGPASKIPDVNRDRRSRTCRERG
jgi:hypothetical protein